MENLLSSFRMLSNLYFREECPISDCQLLSTHRVSSKYFLDLRENYFLEISAVFLRIYLRDNVSITQNLGAFAKLPLSWESIKYKVVQI
jgi:hypothetical protein